MSINSFKVILGIMALIMFFLMIFSVVYAVYAGEDIELKIMLIGVPIWGIQLMSLTVPNK